MHKLCISLTFIFIIISLQAQDLDFVKKQIGILSSPKFQGRGYVKNGDKIAAQYLGKQFKSFDLQPFGPDYFQTYNFTVNTFPNKMEVKIDGKLLQPARDYYVNPASAKIKGNFPIVHYGLKDVNKDTSQIKSFFRANHNSDIIMVDTAGWGKNEIRKTVYGAFSGNLLKAKGIIDIVDSGTIYSVRTFQNEYTRLTLKRKAIPENAKTIQLNIDQKLIDHTTQNIIGYLPGETDTFMVFTAHYDHLGHMGKNTYFPGANDNASGTAMVLDLIRELSQKKTHRYSYAFMLFSGEEAGLLGSSYYVQHPLFPLNKIKMVLNFDMVGTGAGGVNIFNGTVHPKEYHLLDSINKTNNFGVVFNQKSTSRGSDHYPFHQRGIPALFILTEDKGAPYHVPQDVIERLTFKSYENLYKIIYQYIEAKENGQIVYSSHANR
jgi:hypothetical protein